MKKALEGLKGVAKVEMDLDHDLFRVTLTAQDSVPPDRRLETVRDLHYQPRISEADRFKNSDEPFHPAGDPPGLLKDAFARAKAEGKRFVIVDCGGDR